VSTIDTKAERKARTITLTDRAPVRIYEDEWPLVAQASGSDDPEHPSQANEKWTAKVREHHIDGRRIVYGIRESGNGGMPMDYEGWRGGELIPPDGPATIAAIKALDVPVACQRDCIADLPAEDI
jgi:hypothetical protein